MVEMNGRSIVGLFRLSELHTAVHKSSENRNVTVGPLYKYCNAIRVPGTEEILAIVNKKKRWAIFASIKISPIARAEGISNNQRSVTCELL